MSVENNFFNEIPRSGFDWNVEESLVKGILQGAKNRSSERKQGKDPAAFAAGSYFLIREELLVRGILKDLY